MRRVTQLEFDVEDPRIKRLAKRRACLGNRIHRMRLMIQEQQNRIREMEDERRLINYQIEVVIPSESLLTKRL